MRTIAYIRPDKLFDSSGKQIQAINAYVTSKNITIDNEFIDQLSQNKRISQREHVTDYFQSRKNSTIIVYDVWVLSSNLEDLTQMFSCMMKNHFTVHFVKQSIIICDESSAVLVLGLIDQLRKILQSESKKVIGRPKGSKSSSKFDVHSTEIMNFIKERKSVSYMARTLGVSRSSLKDYIESRELKQVALGSLLIDEPEDAKLQIVNSLICPNKKELAHE